MQCTAGQKAVFLKVPYRSGKLGGTVGDVRFAFRQECEANRAGGWEARDGQVSGDAIRRCDMACCSLSLSGIFLFLWFGFGFSPADRFQTDLTECAFPFFFWEEKKRRRERETRIGKEVGDRVRVTRSWTE